MRVRDVQWLNQKLGGPRSRKPHNRD
jgi:hypothetical protein